MTVASDDAVAAFVQRVFQMLLASSSYARKDRETAVATLPERND
jgi:hypothetical protein